MHDGVGGATGRRRLNAISRVAVVDEPVTRVQNAGAASHLAPALASDLGVVRFTE